MSHTVVFALFISYAARVWADQPDVERLTASEQVVKEIMAADDKAIPGSLFQKAYCAVVIPKMKKAGFVFSAKYGRGFASGGVSVAAERPSYQFRFNLGLSSCSRPDALLEENQR